MKIEYDLIVVKLLNFLFYAGMACFMPYKAIFQKSIGLSSSQNGIIQALEKSITLVSPPLIGGFADKYSFHKSSMIICILLSVAFTLPMYFIPSVDSSSNPVISCYQSTANVWCISDNSTFLEKCNNISLVNEDYSITCNDVYNVSMTLTCNIHQENDNVSNINSTKPVMLECREQSIENEEFGSTFILVVVFTLFYAFFTNPVQPLIDATTMNMLGEGRMGDYGKQRLWGSIGFGSIALLIGFATDLYSKSKQTSDEDYLFSFVGASVFGVLTALVCWKLKVPKHNPPSILSGLGVLVKDPRIISLLGLVMVGGYNLGVKYAFVFWYVEGLPGCNQTILGLAVLVGCVTEVPMFFISGWVAEKVGNNSILVVGLLFASLRCFLYTVLTSAWQLLLVEALHGFSFALPMAAMCSYSAALAPPGMTATLIGLTQGVYWGLGNMLGALVGGVLYRIYSPIVMFRTTALLGVVTAIIYTISVACLRNYNPELKVKVDYEAAELEPCHKEEYSP